MNDLSKIKQLQTQLNILIEDSETLKTQLQLVQKEYNQKLQSISNLQKKIDSLDSSTEIQISEHAIIRYLERVKEVDISEIKKEILSDDIIFLIKKLGGSGKYPNKDFQIVMKNYVITTIIK